MDRRVEWTEVALEDVEQVAAFIARDSARYATALVQEVLAQAASLDELAERGRVVPEIGRREVRELRVGRYRLVYHVGRDAVHILGLIHGARDLPSLWDRESRPVPPDTRDA